MANSDVGKCESIRCDDAYWTMTVMWYQIFDDKIYSMANIDAVTYTYNNENGDIKFYHFPWYAFRIVYKPIYTVYYTSITLMFH